MWPGETITPLLFADDSLKAEPFFKFSLSSEDSSAKGDGSDACVFSLMGVG
jgi:hypothetical protein